MENNNHLNKIREKNENKMRIHRPHPDEVLLGIGIKGYIHLDIAHVLAIN